VPKNTSVEVPAELERLLAADLKARRVFDGLPPSHQREWANHVAEAKGADTRKRRAQRCLDEFRAVGR